MKTILMIDDHSEGSYFKGHVVTLCVDGVSRGPVAIPTYATPCSVNAVEIDEDGIATLTTCGQTSLTGEQCEEALRRLKGGQEYTIRMQFGKAYQLFPMILGHSWSDLQEAGEKLKASTDELMNHELPTL